MPSSPLRPPGEIRLVIEGGSWVLHLWGRIDTAAVEAFKADTLPTTQGRERIDVIDAAAVTFLNSVGVRLLRQLTQQARAAGSSPVLRRPSSAALRVLRVTHMAELFDAVD
jgi:anti-anti-sigma factor